MSIDSQKIITVLEVLLPSLEDETSIRRVRKWLGEQQQSAGEIIKPSAKEPRQLLLDTRRNLLREAKRIESSL